MLGFGNKVGRISDQDKANKFMEFMEQNKKIFEVWIEIDKKRDKKSISIINYYDFKYAFISDSIVMSFVPKIFTPPIQSSDYFRHSANLFYLMVNRIVTLMTNLLLNHQILLRGGISTKFSHIQNEFVVGEGLIEAYKLESKKAVVPRIIFSKEITDSSSFMEALKFTSNKLYNNSRLIKRDVDGYFYIDYIGYMISQTEDNTVRIKIHLQHLSKLQYEKKKISDLIVNNSFFELHKQAIQSMYKFLELKKGTEEYTHIYQKCEWIKKYHNSHMGKERKIFYIEGNEN